MTHPHRIDSIPREERRCSRNCLRVDYISRAYMINSIDSGLNIRKREARDVRLYDTTRELVDVHSRNYSMAAH